MNEENLNLLFDRLTPLAEKIGEGAAFLWEVSLRQVPLSGLGHLLAAIALFALGVVWARMALAQHAEVVRLRGEVIERLLESTRNYRTRYPSLSKLEMDRAFDGYLLWRPIALLGLIPAAVGLFPLWAAVSRLLNPGYYAVDAMMRAVGL